MFIVMHSQNSQLFFLSFLVTVQNPLFTAGRFLRFPQKLLSMPRRR